MTTKTAPRQKMTDAQKETSAKRASFIAQWGATYELAMKKDGTLYDRTVPASIPKGTPRHETAKLRQIHAARIASERADAMIGVSDLDDPTPSESMQDPKTGRTMNQVKALRAMRMDKTQTASECRLELIRFLNGM